MTLVAFTSLGIPTSRGGTVPVLEGKTDRPLRYRPEAGGFVIDNGPDSFNRPLYGGPTAFRVDAGDRPEFSLYLPGRGGVLRVGLNAGGKAVWLRDAKNIQACYADGAMSYVITDPAFGGITVKLTVVALRDFEGLALRVDLDGQSAPADLLFAYGGLTGEKHKRNGDIGTDSVPMSEYFRLKPDHCRGTTVNTEGAGFRLTTKVAEMSASCTGSVAYAAADATEWGDAVALVRSAGRPTERPVALATAHAAPSTPTTFALKRMVPEPPDRRPTTSRFDYLVPALAESAFDKAIEQNRAVARRVVVDTPDPYINSAVNALCLAADAIKDPSGTVMHGGVAWRQPLLGWRGPYAFDAMGEHDYARSHLSAYFKKQSTKPPVATQPAADEKENLARSENQLRTEGDLTDSHYDMNLVAVDNFFRHLLWTGDLAYAKQQWPVIQKHFEWEKRLFRRPFGPEGLPLYEAYACIWASDDLQYSGGGVTHASAYNYYHNLMAARVAGLIGEDPKPFADEAALIKKAMQQYLWLPNEGHFAEYKDLLGNQNVHPAAGLWTHYHTIDSLAADPMQAYQMSRYVGTQFPMIPIHGPGVPEELLVTLASTNWMPYTWSINNVAMAEVTHTALADWQANDRWGAFKEFKGAIVDSMFLGQCPGNVHMTSFFDAYRQEAQRDSGDPIGITWRAMIEGLFGITPDALAGEVTIKPGFPAEWEHASITHPNLAYVYRREGQTDAYTIEPKFAKPMRLRLRLPARGERVLRVSVNGEAAKWTSVEGTVGLPLIDIVAPSAAKWDVTVTWGGPAPLAAVRVSPVSVETNKSINVEANGPIEVVGDLRHLTTEHVPHGSKMTVHVGQVPGIQTLFLKVKQGDLTSWQPAEFLVYAPPVPLATTVPAGGTWEAVDVSASFNDSVTQIFKNKYVSPRSPYCSLAIPVQGFGGWATNKVTPTVDDSGLRALGGTVKLPNGVTFATPSAAGAKNVLFTSQWDNYPREATVPLSGKSGHAYLLMAGTTNAMQSRLDNGEVIVTYADGGTERLALRNPETWWPIEQDYFVDDYQFRIDAPLPPRVDLKTGHVRLPTKADLGSGKSKIDGGAATVLDLPLDPKRELKSLTVRTLANEVVVGLMAVTLQRP